MTGATMPKWLIDRYHDRMVTHFAPESEPLQYLVSAGPGVVIAYDAEDRIMWIEIVNVSRRVRDEGLRDETGV